MNATIQFDDQLVFIAVKVSEVFAELVLSAKLQVHELPIPEQFPLVPRDEPEADGDLSGIEKLPGHRHHAVHQVGLDDVLADFALARLVGGHRTVGQNKASRAVRGQVVDKVLDPDEVCIPGWRCGEFPSLVVLVHFSAPVGIVVGLISHTDVADHVEQLAEPLLVETRMGVILGQHALERGVITFNGEHGVVNDFTDGRPLGFRFELGPAGLLGHPIDAERIGGTPDLGFEAEIRPIAVFFGHL